MHADQPRVNDNTSFFVVYPIHNSASAAHTGRFVECSNCRQYVYTYFTRCTDMKKAPEWLVAEV